MNAVRLRVKLNKGAAASSSADTLSEHLFADNLVLNTLSSNEWIGLDDLYQTITEENPDYQPYAEPTDKSFDFTGGVQTFTAPATATYSLELWGAQGGSYSGSNGGHGGYSSGKINLTKGDTLYIYVGGTTSSGAGGWNGGGSTSRVAKGGGGATDIRKGGQALTDRIIVAGGGGGAQAGAGGVGGGTTGGTGFKNCCGTVGSGGTQSAGGTGGGMPGVLGIGGNGGTGSDGNYGGAGGGGYYGGGGADTDHSLVDDGGGGGGSGYIGGVLDGTTYDGAASIPSPSGGTETGHSGSGYARITSAGTAGSTTTFNYTGALQTYSVPKSGKYTIQAWGAEGGFGYASTSSVGGKGGYSKGTFTFNAGDVLSLYVGGKGTDSTTSGEGGWNGGGTGNGTPYGGGGGGASDVRTSGAVYALDSGLTLRDGTTRSGTTAIMDAPNEGVYGPYIPVTPGRYQIDVYGKGLSNGGAVIYTDYGSTVWTNYVTYINRTDTHVTYYVDIPSSTSIAEFCWHANNYAAQQFEYETISKLADRIIVAGGGGGGSAEYGTEPGGAGGGANQGGLPGTGQSGTHSGGGGTLNSGGSSSGNAGAVGAGGNGMGQSGGGGGGYFGGGGGGPSPDGGAGGGSGYVDSSGSDVVGYTGAQSMPSASGGTETGHSGNGVILITEPTADPGPPYITTTNLIPQSADPPPEAYIYTPISYDPTSEIKIPGGGTYKPGNFVNLDYGFQLYFPNIGDFYGNGAQGISRTSEIEGKGFMDAMSTTEWTKSKAVQFQFIVLYNGKTYLPNEWIDLDVNQEKFDFYVPLAASEYASALVQFKSVAINGTDDENDAPLNKTRYNNFAARHSALKRYNVDVVGNIGNMVIEDTGDFRFSNFFKQAVTPTQWLVKGVVKKVDPTKQNKIIGDTIDIHGRPTSTSTQFLNTFGLLPHLQQMPTELPLSPEKNNIAALQKQPMRMGYNILADIQTTGNYYDTLQILPYYYRLNLKTGEFLPVDVYMNVNGVYKIINKFGAAVPGWDTSSVYPYVYTLDWENEKARRNFSVGEQEATNSAITLAISQFSLDTTGTGKTAEPNGNSYRYGTAQVMNLTGRNRTFMGNDETYGESKNPDYRLNTAMYNIQGQRWHFTYGLPSSAVVVKAGEPITQANIDDYRTNTSVIVMAADIKSIGDVWALDYKIPGGNNPIAIAGTSYSTSSISYPILSVFSINKSSADDLEVSGTH